MRTLTNHPQRPGAAEDLHVEVAPLQFIDRDALVDSLRGADVLYNTYWIRFPHRGTGFGDAIANTRKLVNAAAEAGVRKIVHISVSNPSPNSHLDYYAGKARTEGIVQESGISWAVVRPTLIFGPGDILINNIAWLLRRVPFFLVPGQGAYRLQPVAGEDVADIAVWASAQSENVTVDAAGPDVITFAELVHSVAIAVGRQRHVFGVPPTLALLASNVIGRYVRDVVITRQELAGLMEELLVSNEPARGHLRLDAWLLRNADAIGRSYASELDRHFR